MRTMESTLELEYRHYVCQLNQQCFISMKPIDCGEPVARVYHPALRCEVRVLRRFVLDGSLPPL